MFIRLQMANATGVNVTLDERMANATGVNVTLDERMANATCCNKTLEELNRGEVERRILLLVYLTILIIIGIPGNVSVLVIFIKHYKEGAYRIYRVFVVTLAILDTITCSISVPFEIADTVLVYTFENVAACKIFRTVELIVTMTTIFVILSLTVYRYRKVYRPLENEKTEKIAIGMCVSSIVFSFSVSSPFFEYNGIKTIELRPNVNGSDCSFSDDYAHSQTIKIHGGLIVSGYLAIMIAIIVMYCCIRKTLSRQASKMKRKHETPHICGNSDIPKNEDINKTKSENLNKSLEQLTENSRAKSKSREEIDSAKRAKITKVAFVVTVLFVVSYLPVLVVTAINVIARNALPHREHYMGSVVFPIAWRLSFLSSIGNPIIYAYHDDKFKGLLKDFLQKRYCKRSL